MEEVTGIVSETFVTETKSFLIWIKDFLTWDNLFKLIFAVIVIFALWLAYKLIVRGIKKIPPEKTTVHKTALLIRIVKYVFYVLVVMYVLGLFGVKLSAIWGAAGIAGVAIGFAAQTSVSNLISGLFVLTEGAIKVGDLISVDGVMGTVDTISLLSIRIYTPDNQMIRIPNSSIINNELTNYSYHDKRRFTFSVSIGYDMNMEKALETLKKAPDLCPTVLKEPEPKFWFDGFGESGINMVAAVWFNGSDLIQTKNDMYIAIKKVFDNAKIEIPYNKIVVIENDG